MRILCLENFPAGLAQLLDYFFFGAHHLNAIFQCYLFA